MEGFLSLSKACSQLLVMIVKKKDYRKLRVFLVSESLGAVNDVVLWLKSLPWSVTWAFPLRSPIISKAYGAQPNPSSSKQCGQQSVRCDHQLITHYPPDQAQSLHRCEASLALNTLTGRSLADERLPQTGFVKGLLWTVKLSPLWESGCSEVSVSEYYQINLWTKP